MLDLDANPWLRRLYQVARTRVTLGFLVAGIAFWLATPTWGALGAGTVLSAAGEVLRVWAAGHLRKGQEVTTSGPYRFVRHPLYVGSAVMGLGFAVASADFIAASLVIGYLTVMLVVAVTLEEATLRDAFGPDYDKYAKGRLSISPRRFSLNQAIQNGEHRAVLGLGAALGVLVLKAL